LENAPAVLFEIKVVNEELDEVGAFSNSDAGI
jgi:hypothetical protein